MKSLLTFTALIFSFATFAQPDASYYGRYMNETGLSGFDFASIENTDGSCFIALQNTYDESGEVTFSYIGYGSCQKTGKSFTVNMVETDRGTYMVDFFLDKQKKPAIKVRKEGAPDQVYTMTMDANALEAWYVEHTPEEDPYYDDEDYYDDEEYTDGEEVEFSDDEFTMPDTYSRADGSAISILPAEDGTGTSFFAIVAADYEDCGGNNILEGILKPGSSANEWYAEADGCKYVTVVVSENSVTVTEKKCSSMDRGSCKTLSGVYTKSGF
ncbi:MAG TPA: hypothetical protein VK151_14600 [Fluviicola sp.]|nr:hypothetical protein [Fluviicola sp.]